MIENDNELLKRYVHDDDHEAFEQIVRRYYGMVFGLCLNMFSKREDAEDAFQMIFITLSANASKLKSHDNICGWLHETSLRTCLCLRRKLYRKREINVKKIDSLAVDGHWQRIATQSEIETIHKEIVQLPANYRNVIILCHLQGKSRAQAAEILNTTTASIKSTLSRARKMLRIRLLRCGIATTVVLGMNCATFAQPCGPVSDSLIQSVLHACCNTPTSATCCVPHTALQGKLATVSNFSKTVLLAATGIVLMGVGLFSLWSNSASFARTKPLEIVEPDSTSQLLTGVSFEVLPQSVVQDLEKDDAESYEDKRQQIIDESIIELTNVIKRELYLRVDFNRRFLKLKDDQVDLLRIFAAGFAEKRVEIFERDLARKLNKLALDRLKSRNDHGGITINEQNAIPGEDGGIETQIELTINRHEAGGRVSVTMGTTITSLSDFKGGSSEIWAFEHSPVFKKCIPLISDNQRNAVLEAVQGLTLSERQYLELHKEGLDESDQRSRIIRLIELKLTSDLLITEDQSQALQAWLDEHVAEVVDFSANIMDGPEREVNMQVSSICYAREQMYSIDADLPDCFSEIQKDLFLRAKHRHRRALR